ncbi:hypothetical protein Ahy_B02g059983 [Arachis hypogaea]|uniref:Protein FAR1-RELATED SEQUENCE n=1 Tax=Arachis hypogaea TaxID=3818 RepID=A0A445AHQ3_ARAHY|nr:hypothetical protein Ahy_B02g059983 [Arachis hypogaea]
MTTCLRSIERHAAMVYTREVFGDVKKEIEGVGALNQINKRRILNTMVYTLEEYEEPNLHITASFGRSTSKVSCQCNFWKKHGYPYKHMFFVMKEEHLKEIPDKLVLRRWRTDAKSLEQYTKSWGNVSEHGVILRHGALHSALQWMFFLGAQRLALFQKAMHGIQSLCKDLELDYKAFHGGVSPSTEHAGEANAVVRDLLVAQSKGASKLGNKKGHGKRRRCTCCKGMRHTKRTCPAKGDNNEQHDLRDDAFEGDDLDMPDRDDEHVGDNLFLDPNGTANNVYHNTVIVFCIADLNIVLRIEIIHSWRQDWYNCKAKTGAHATYQQASITREAVSWVDKLGVP